MEQTFRWNKEMIPKIFEQMLEQIFGRNKKIAQIVFQLYLDFNNAHTQFIPAGLFLFCRVSLLHKIKVILVNNSPRLQANL